METMSDATAKEFVGIFNEIFSSEDPKESCMKMSALCHIWGSQFVSAIDKDKFEANQIIVMAIQDLLLPILTDLSKASSKIHVAAALLALLSGAFEKISETEISDENKS